VKSHCHDDHKDFHQIEALKSVPQKLTISNKSKGSSTNCSDTQSLIQCGETARLDKEFADFMAALGEDPPKELSRKKAKSSGINKEYADFMAELGIDPSKELPRTPQERLYEKTIAVPCNLARVLQGSIEIDKRQSEVCQSLLQDFARSMNKCTEFSVQGAKILQTISDLTGFEMKCIGEIQSEESVDHSNIEIKGIILESFFNQNPVRRQLPNLVHSLCAAICPKNYMEITNAPPTLDIIGLVIGPRRKTWRLLENTSGAKFEVDLKPCKTATFIIIGLPEQVEACKQVIRELVAGAIAKVSGGS